jgi:presenilin-like A22 family membrane protease
MSSPALFASRILVALAVGTAAVVCLSSSVFAAIIGGLTVTMVVWDVLVYRTQPIVPTSHPVTPKRLNVDLSRRSRRP